MKLIFWWFYPNWRTRYYLHTSILGCTDWHSRFFWIVFRFEFVLLNVHSIPHPQNRWKQWLLKYSLCLHIAIMYSIWWNKNTFTSHQIKQLLVFINWNNDIHICTFSERPCVNVKCKNVLLVHFLYHELERQTISFLTDHFLHPSDCLRCDGHWALALKL